MGYTRQLWDKRVAGRSDLSSQVIHLTRPTEFDGKKVGPVDLLVRILTEARLSASTTDKGFICGDIPATCFQDVPVYSLSQNIHAEEQYRAAVEGAKVRYVGVGLMFPKPYVYARGGRPVIYEDTDKAKAILPKRRFYFPTSTDTTAFLGYAKKLRRLTSRRKFGESSIWVRCSTSPL